MLATDKQMSYLRSLMDEKLTDEAKRAARGQMERGLSRDLASRWIDKLQSMPRAEGKAPEALTPGVYENDEGVFVVKPNKAKTRLYAKKLVEIGGERLTEAGTIVEIEFDYAPGAIYRLTEADRMPLDKAKELTIRYGRCIVCGRRLKAAVSVERGIGPVCIKSFA